MSTKQAVIFTFMLIFLATFLGALGAWFNFSAELDAKDKTIEMLKIRAGQLKVILDGTNVQKGLRKEVDDPVEGLGQKLQEATERAKKVVGTEDSGFMKTRETLYGQKEQELATKMPGAAAKWASLYQEWNTLNKNIDEAAQKLKAQNAESEQKMSEAKTELEQQLSTETVEKKKIIEERRKVADEMAKIRTENEQIQDKIIEVTRETRKVEKVVPQARVIGASQELRILTIDKGREDGVRKGMIFTVYSGRHTGLVKMALVEVTAVHPSSADAVIVPANRVNIQDPVTGWVPSDPAMRYSIYAGGGPDENSALELIKPKTRQDRIEAYRTSKLEREGGVDKTATAAVPEQQQATAPPAEFGKGFVPITVGDWVHNPDFVPIIAESAYQKKAVDELLRLRDVNLNSLTFLISETIRPYRREFIKRLCERNRCRAVDTMSPDVNVVVAPPGMTEIAPLEDKLAASKGKDEVSAEIKTQRRALETLVEARKIGAQTLAEDKVEEFFSMRQRKTELLRGKTIQPGRSTFFVAGDTKERSVDQTRRYIADNGGVPTPELDSTVDYVVVGSGLGADFFEKVKKLGVKIIREDELPRFFGLE